VGAGTGAGHGTIWYVYVPENTVDPRVAAAARSVVIRAAADLGLGQIYVRWFCPADALDRALDRLARMAGAERRCFAYGAGLVGVTTPLEPDTIALSAALTARDVGRVVRHEARHLWQFRQHIPPADEEGDAEQYALLGLRRL